MTKITIHWQKMQFHKSLSISVTTRCWAWWEIEVQLVSWYSLSELPPWTTIVRDASSSTIFYLYYWWQSICTIAAYWDVQKWYALEGCVINRWWQKITVNTTPIELENWDVIWFTFEQVNTVLWFYSDAIWQWYDGSDIVSGAKLPVWLYYISSFTQATSNSYALTISWDSTYTYYYKWSTPITVDYIEINESQESIPYSIVSWDYLRVRYTEIPWVNLETNEYWAWYDYYDNEIDFVPVASWWDSIQLTLNELTDEWPAIFNVSGATQSFWNRLKYVPINHCAIVSLGYDYWHTKIINESFNVSIWDTLVWEADIARYEWESYSEGSTLANNLMNNSWYCLSDPQPQPLRGINYMIQSDRDSSKYFLIEFSQSSGGYMVWIVDSSWNVIQYYCFSYGSWPLSIADFQFYGQILNNAYYSWTISDFSGWIMTHTPIYSTAQIGYALDDYFF